MQVTFWLSDTNTEAMTFPDMKSYNEAFNKTVAEIQHGIGQTMVTLGNNAFTLLKKRVTETGKDANGVAYKPYSTKPMLANCSSMTTEGCNKIASSKPKRKELSWVTLKRGDRNIRLFELKGGYKQFRELQNRRTDIVNFSFYNDMWNDIGIISGPSDHQNGTVIIGAKQEEQKKKLEGNTARRGDILDLSTSEIDELKSDFGLKVLNVFKEHNLA